MIDEPDSPPVDETVECDHDASTFKGSSERVILRAAALLRAAGEPERLRLLERLGHAEACVGELAKELGWGMPTISGRLKVLHQEGLISRRREGQHIYYALDDDHVLHLLKNVMEHVTEDR